MKSLKLYGSMILTAFIVSLLIVGLTKVVLAANLNSKYEQLLLKIGNAEIYKISTISACAKAKGKVVHLSVICSKNINDIPDSLINEATLASLKQYVVSDDLDELLALYEQERAREVSKRYLSGGGFSSDDDKEYYIMLRNGTDARKALSRFWDDDESLRDIDKKALKYLKERDKQ